MLYPHNMKIVERSKFQLNLPSLLQKTTFSSILEKVSNLFSGRTLCSTRWLLHLLSSALHWHSRHCPHSVGAETLSFLFWKCGAGGSLCAQTRQRNFPLYTLVHVYPPVSPGELQNNRIILIDI